MSALLVFRGGKNSFLKTNGKTLKRMLKRGLVHFSSVGHLVFFGALFVKQANSQTRALFWSG